MATRTVVTINRRFYKWFAVCAFYRSREREGSERLMCQTLYGDDISAMIARGRPTPAPCSECRGLIADPWHRCKPRGFLN